MTDKEMLEYAAKAAGIKAYWSVTDSIQKYPVFVTTGGGKMGTIPYEEEWNPLKDDALAFRLMVKLGIDILFDTPDSQTAQVTALRDSVFEAVELSEVHKNDPCAATRLAVTRAAAEVGKAMP